MARVVFQDSHIDKTLNFRSSGFLFHVFTSIGILLLLYFPLSIGLTFYQQSLLKDFHYPLMVVTVHLITKFLAVAICRSLWRCWTGRSRVRLDWPNNIRRIAPTGIASGWDIGFSNWGIGLITVSLYTMTKSTSVVFILFFSLLFKLEEKSWSLFLTVTMVSGGLLLFTYKAAQFVLKGFLFVLFASLCSGLRWTLAQFVMQKSELGLTNPVDMLYHVQPWMFLSIIPFVIIWEAGRAIEAWNSLVFPQDSLLVWTRISSIFLGSFIALAMELAEYLVVSRMSSLTLSVAGIFKEVCTLTLAILWNGDVISMFNSIGLVLCIAGIILHVVRTASKESEKNTARQSQDEATARSSVEMVGC